ncbi:MAG: DUF5011 domain-containing protein, partial [Bacilli bacterium]
VGKYVVTFKALDTNNNESIVIKEFIVKDMISPTITVNNEFEMEINTILPEFNITVNDNYDKQQDLTVKVDTTKVNIAKIGQYNVDITVSDKSNNIATKTIIVKVIDTIAPVITLVDKDITLSLNTTYIEPGYKVSDNSKEDLKATITSNLDITKIGTYTITYTVTDKANNTTTITRTVTIIASSLDTLFREDNRCESNSNCFSQTNADTNYVWYSGYLWRIYKSNIDGSTKLITQGSISSSIYDETNSIYKDSYINSWLNDTFYNSLNNPSLLANAAWCNLNTTNADNNRTTCTTSNIVNAKVGLLTLFEYNLVGGSTSYLNNKDRFFTMTRYGNASLWAIDNNGNKQTGEMVYNVDAIRPVITLVPNVDIVEGNGTVSSPYRIKTDESAKPNTNLNKRFTGEYVKFNNQLWRVVTTDNNGTKLILDSFLTDESGIITNSYGLDNNFNLLSGIGKQLNDYYRHANVLNTVWFESNYAWSQNPIGTSIKTNTNYINSLAGLIRIGELMSGTSATLDNKGKTYWTMTKSDDGKVWHISTTGGAATDKLEAPRAIRPVVKVSNNFKITSGNGTYNSPYLINE